ncbi:GNAT family N-acetyltransferase [Pasteurella oralis]|uniref:GNAT family N-acetyltransferase n=1 Tax=Pasteurella oralis TaxID=1071947 RepID=UPI000C79E046|nr:GNAT family N-acetyltransferase [Pasteurella oralis]
MSSPFKIVPFDKRFDRENFECSSEELNNYLRKQASQDVKKHVSSCFLVIDSNQKMLGYYTLASMSVPLLNLPEALRKKLPRYPSVPAVLLGRLAVDKQAQGKGLGQALVGNALKKVIRSEIAAYALIVDAKDEQAVAFYRKLGFIPFLNETRHLFFPLEKVREFIEKQS